MAFSTTSLPNSGRTAHFAVSYDDTLSKADGLDQALDLLKHCENDLGLIWNWFTGIGFIFNFPIGVLITGQWGGAIWEDPADISRYFGFNPTVTIKPGPQPAPGLIRYLLVSEVTEMYMASQQKQWYESTSFFCGADEGSMGESLSRFLASEFLTATGISKSIYPGFHVADIWLDDPLRPDVIDVVPDDNKPDSTTGGGTCFLFYLKDQLYKSIQSIIAAAAPTLGGVYTNLTGKTDGWQSFKNLVDSHYPQGIKYFPPLDNVFPVAELTNFMTPFVLSWVENDPNVAVLVLSPSIPVNVDVELTSDDPQTIGLPTKALMNSSWQTALNVPVQGPNFVSKVVNLTASYAGKKLTNSITVVRPENLPVTPLEIKLVFGADSCAQQFVEGSSVSFYVTNPNVIRDHTGLTYKWTVSGAAAPVTNASTLDIPSLPAAGTKVTVEATLTNAYGIHSTGTFTFTTAQKESGMQEAVRWLQCYLGQVKTINNYIPPWVPIEEGGIPIEQLVKIEQQAKQMIVAIKRVVASIEVIRAEQDERERMQQITR